MSKAKQQPDYAKAKREAHSLLTKFGIETPPVNPVEIARQLGTRITFVRFADDHDNISGFFDVDDNTIYVNENEHPLRQTFTVAHELGHCLLHREWASSSDYKILLRDSSGDQGDFHEKEANHFAAHLLVPRRLLDRYYEDSTPAELSRLFAVSVPTIKYRLANEYGI